MELDSHILIAKEQLIYPACRRDASGKLIAPYMFTVVVYRFLILKIPYLFCYRLERFVGEK
jgi:hypothetical protein